MQITVGRPAGQALVSRLQHYSSPAAAADHCTLPLPSPLLTKQTWSAAST